ncbi:MAG TPA: hypothetical protein VFR07_11265 [Mycobacteriales bacterium]|nr:hypothetical protein [Mycobacteriales bacterium]
MTVRPALAAAALALALAGCTSDGGATAPASPAAATSGPAVQPGGTAATGAASPTPDEDSPPVLTLQGDGLGLLAADESVAPLPFGTTGPADVRAAVEDALGPTTEVPLPACPQGPRTALQVEGFSVLFDGESFVGWTDVGAPDRVLTTAEGIGTGSSVVELQSAVPDAQIGQDPTGATTFSSPGGLSGVLSGPEPEAQVRALSAGQTCPGP